MRSKRAPSEDVLVWGCWYSIDDLCVVWGLNRHNRDERFYAHTMANYIGLVYHLDREPYFSKVERLKYRRFEG